MTDQTETKDFHLGDVLTITTGRLLSTRHMEGVYDILNWMSDDELMTHQLPSVSQEAKPFLLSAHPALASVEVPEITSQESLDAFLATLYPTLGEHLAVPRMPADAHERKNALVEMAEMMRPDQEILVVEVPGSAGKRLGMTDVAEIVRLYVEEKLNSAEIEKLTGVNQKRVLRILEKEGVPRRRGYPVTPDQAARARMLRAEGMPLTWIAEDLGIPADALRPHTEFDPVASKEWLRVWGSIRPNDELRALHEEFAPTSSRILRALTTA